MPLAKYAASRRQLQLPSSEYAAFLGKLNPSGLGSAQILKRNRTPKRPANVLPYIIPMAQG
ncbi:hypothetical protein GE278_06345 [Enterobacteriaceae bacterium Kacie_13]|nr:hypothetical protein GE278_06345 [Enterobacteriaceae bacterium Kacie_13]